LKDTIKAFVLIKDSIVEYRLKALFNHKHPYGILHHLSGLNTSKALDVLGLIFSGMQAQPVLAGWIFEDADVKVIIQDTLKRASMKLETAQIAHNFEQFWSGNILLPRDPLSDKSFEFVYPSVATL